MRIRNLEVEVPLITHAQRSCKFRIDSINMFVKNKHLLASHFLQGTDNWLIISMPFCLYLTIVNMLLIFLAT